MRIALWIVQVLLAAVFLLAGTTKFMMPLDEMVAESGLPGWFILFIGTAEVLGAVGLILPGLLRIRTGLTPLAAAGLTIIMIGAVVDTVLTMDALLALIPGVVGLLAAFVAYGRWQLAPLGRSSDRRLAAAY